DRNVTGVQTCALPIFTLLPLLNRWQGGGHKQAGSAMIKKGDFQHVVKDINEHLEIMIQPAITANDIMMSPVKTISPDTTLEKAGHLMYRYGHKIGRAH